MPGLTKAESARAAVRLSLSQPLFLSQPSSVLELKFFGESESNSDE